MLVIVASSAELMTTANTSLVATTVSASAVAAAAAAAVASLAFLISVIMVASAVTATVTSPTRSTAIAVVRGTARSHGVEMEMGWETAGWVGSKVSKILSQEGEKDRGSLFWATVGSGREDAHLSLCNLADGRLSSLEPPGGEKKEQRGAEEGGTL